MSPTTRLFPDGALCADTFKGYKHLAKLGDSQG